MNRLRWWLKPGVHETPRMRYYPLHILALAVMARCRLAGCMTINETRQLYGLTDL